MKKVEFKENISKKEQFKKALVAKFKGGSKEDKSILLPELKVEIIDKK